MNTIVEIIKERGVIGRSLILAVILALILGFIGHVQEALGTLAPADRTPERIVKVVLESVPAAMRVFTPKIYPNPGNNSMILTIGEFLGSLTAFAAVIAVIGSFFSELWEKLRIGTLRKHSILIGFDDQARLFLEAPKVGARRNRVVVLDPLADDTSRAQAHGEGCFHYTANDKHHIAANLKSCAVHRASRLVISAGDDHQSLSVLRQIAQSTALKNCEALEVLLVVRDATTYHRLAGNDEFMQCLGPNARLRLFSPAHGASDDLSAKVNFTLLAHRRRQSRPVLLLCGQDDVATEVLCEFLRTSPGIGMKRPKVLWIVRDRETALRSLGDTVATLADLVRAEPAAKLPLSWAAQIDMYAPAPDEALSDCNFLRRCICEDHVTAIVVTRAADPGGLPIRTAQGIRDAARQLPGLQAPCFVYSPSESALDELLNRMDDGATIQEDVFEPFGRIAEMQRWGGIDAELEGFAKALHEKYLAKRQAEASAEGERDASNRPWTDLSETYKNANRRAAKRIEMVSYWQNHLASSEGEMSDDEILEAVSELEHASWSITQELDGWRHGQQRDNRRKLHPDLIPYSGLSDEIKDYDRAQVRTFLEVKAQKAL